MGRSYSNEVLDVVADATRALIFSAENEDPFAPRSVTIYRVRRRFDHQVEFESHDYEEANTQFWRLTARAVLDAYHEEESGASTVSTGR